MDIRINHTHTVERQQRSITLTTDTELGAVWEDSRIF